MNVLVVNCGSSSLKYALFGADGATLERGSRERLAPAGGDGEGAGDGAGHESGHAAAIAEVLETLGARGGSIDAVGHRVVHGGTLVEPTRIDERALAAIDAAAADAPLHNPFALAGIRAVEEALPGVPQVAVFDTGFHARMPRRSRMPALDPALVREHRLHRVGFHGISHEAAATAAAAFLGRPLRELRLVTLHLGNGASACAVEFGRSVDTSMGATPLAGLVMGARSGDVDPGSLLKLLRQGVDVDALEEILNRESGLAGLSGIGNDLREIEAAAAAGDDRARLAVNVFAHRARKYVGAYASVMGGCDAVVFTGGIGQYGTAMRERIVQRFEFAGLFLDIDANRAATPGPEDPVARVSVANSRVQALVVPSGEERAIAGHVRAALDAERTAEASPPTPIPVPIAVSARHCHLTEATFRTLFGPDATPTAEKPLSQPGQFACAERVNLVGPRGRIDRVRLLGPLRRVDQIEVSRTDEFRLGIDAPVRDSGNVKGSAPVRLEGPAGTVDLPEGLICARRHIHMHPRDAALFGVADGDEVAVAIVGGPRDLVFGDVSIRVKDSYLLEMHIDTDEANAAELGGPAGSAGALSREDVDDALPPGTVYAEVGGGAHAAIAGPALGTPVHTPGGIADGPEPPARDASDLEMTASKGGTRDAPEGAPRA